MSKLNNWFIKVGKCRVYSEGDRYSLNYLKGECSIWDEARGLGFGWGAHRAEGFYLYGTDDGYKNGLGYNSTSYAGSKNGSGCS